MGDYIKVSLIVFLFGFVSLVSTDLVYGINMTPYEKMLEKIDSLSLVLNDRFKEDIENNWGVISHVQQYKTKSVIDSIDRLEGLYHQKKYSEITDALKHLRVSLKHTDTIKQILTYQNEIRQLEQSVIILDSSNKVKNMLKHNEVLDSKIYLYDIWDPIQKKIQNSKTVDDILLLKTEIGYMQKIIEYNSRIYENVHSPVFTIIDPNVKLVWGDFKEEMQQNKHQLFVTCYQNR